MIIPSPLPCVFLSWGVLHEWPRSALRSKKEVGRKKTVFLTKADLGHSAPSPLRVPLFPNIVFVSSLCESSSGEDGEHGWSPLVAGSGRYHRKLEVLLLLLSRSEVVKC